MGLANPFPRLAELGRKAGMGDGTFGMLKAVMSAQRHQQIGNGRLANPRYGVQQVPPPPKIGVIVDVLADAFAGGLQLAVERFDDGFDGVGDGRGGGVQAVFLHLKHFLNANRVYPIPKGGGGHAGAEDLRQQRRRRSLYRAS